MWRMLQRLGRMPPASHHVAVMHYWPFIEQLDEPDWDLTDADQYYDWYFSIDAPYRRRLWDLLKGAGVDILFCGHVHTGRPVQEVEGIRLYRTQPAGKTGQLAERWPDAEIRFGFQRCDVTEDGIEHTAVAGLCFVFEQPVMQYRLENYHQQPEHQYADFLKLLNR